MNVPRHDDSAVRIWLRKVKWVFIAILAPEFVAYVALQQWGRAMEFRKELNVLWNKHHKTEESPSPSSPKAEHFGKDYAFYAVMGGFCADVGFMHNVWTRVTITTEAMLYLAKYGHFVDISGDSIRDKSKADLLAKGLVLFQVLWLAGQAIERKVAGYPITLLEVHTLVHVVCAVCMFFLWLYKPFDVRDATVVNPGEVGEVQECIAWLLLHCVPSNGSIDDELDWFEVNRLSWQGHLIDPSTDGPVPDISHIYGQELQRTGEQDSRVELITSEEQEAQVTTYFRTVNPASGRRDSSGFNIKQTIVSRGDSVLCSLVGGQGLKNGIGLLCSWPINASAADPEGGRLIQSVFSSFDKVCVQLSARDVRRWNLASNFVRGLMSRSPDVFRNDPVRTREWYEVEDIADDELRNLELPISLGIILEKDFTDTRARQSLRYRERNVRNILTDITTSSRILGGALVPLMVLVPAAYGAIHLSALTIAFPTGIEHLLWKIACYIMIGVAGGLTMLLIVMRVGSGWTFFERLEQSLRSYTVVLPMHNVHFMRYVLTQSYDNDSRSRLKKIPLDSLVLSVYVTFYALCIPYVTARAYIVIESFISLRRVPIGVYETPELNFMDYVPHL